MFFCFFFFLTTEIAKAIFHPAGRQGPVNLNRGCSWSVSIPKELLIFNPFLLSNVSPFSFINNLFQTIRHFPSLSDCLKQASSIDTESSLTHCLEAQRRQVYVRLQRRMSVPIACGVTQQAVNVFHVRLLPWHWPISGLALGW